MNLHLIDFPDAAEELSSWLEQKLCGVELRELLSELTAVYGFQKAPCTLNNALRGREAEVLQSGLSVLSAQDIHMLVRYPYLLMQLHERIMLEGGEYWDCLLQNSPAVAKEVEQAKDAIEAQLGKGRSAPFSVDSAKTPPAEPEVVATIDLHENQASWPASQSALVSIVSLVTALSLLAGVLLHDVMLPRRQTVRATVAGWGWSSPEAFSQQGSSSEYLLKLADAADAWFNKKPKEASEVAKRISEFRQGCTVLLLADHQPLSETDRRWLLESCREWADEMNRHLESLESGEPPLEVRAQADQTISKAAAALRNRANG